MHNCKIPYNSLLIFFSLLFCTGCVEQLSDDALEPNDTIEDATEITAVIPIDARENQENSDVFKFEVDAEKILTIDVVSRGKDNCPGFSLIDSNVYCNTQVTLPSGKLSRNL